jgi:hypothetical protein
LNNEKKKVNQDLEAKNKIINVIEVKLSELK